MCERCADLEIENAYLAGELGLVRVTAEDERIRRVLKLTPSEHYVLKSLYAGRAQPFVNGWMIVDGLEKYAPSHRSSQNSLKVYVTMIRRKLGGRAIIRNVWGLGYKLETRGAAAYEKALAGV